MVLLHWRRWDDDFVVFDVGSGQTHQLSPVTAATLMMLETTSGDLVELSTRVASELGIAQDAQLASTVSEALDGLQAVGLIEFAS
jgi:PqqD family protein of HPr-rel-A system